ncbi:MAG: CinA family protein [Dongiaceae bacterium]
MLFPPPFLNQAAEIIKTYAAQKKQLALAESCTGGLIAAVLTEIPGSSAVVERGYVCYANQAKMDDLHVAPGILEKHGAVSAEAAEALIQGLFKNSSAPIALSVTGIAGPTGGSAAKPVGLVFLALAKRGDAVMVERHVFKGGRQEIRLAALQRALELLLSV